MTQCDFITDYVGISQHNVSVSQHNISKLYHIMSISYNFVGLSQYIVNESKPNMNVSQHIVNASMYSIIVRPRNILGWITAKCWLYWKILLCVGNPKLRGNMGT